jgi:hypothetical protein
VKASNLTFKNKIISEFCGRISVTGAVAVRCLLSSEVDIGPLAIGICGEESCEVLAALFPVNQSR